MTLDMLVLVLALFLKPSGYFWVGPFLNSCLQVNMQITFDTGEDWGFRLQTVPDNSLQYPATLQFPDTICDMANVDKLSKNF